MRIAMIGQRGVPATFGGIERHVEELGSRLVERGHDVTVFCRENYVTDSDLRFYRGMRILTLPTIGTKHLDAIVHSGFSSVRAVTGPYDIVHYHALGPGLFAPLPRYLSAKRVVLTVHGLDGQRAKWGLGARTLLRAAGWVSGHVPDATIVVARHLARHYAITYDRHAPYIPNGVTEPVNRPLDQARRFGVDPGAYFLFVGRLVPEKAPDLLLRAFRRLPGDFRLVIAGGSSFTDDYARYLGELAAGDERVVMAGYVYGNERDELYSNAAAFVLPSNLEGLPLTLLEAASFGTPVVTSDIPPHLEVVDHDGPGHRVFCQGDEEGLLRALEAAISDPVSEVEGAKALRERVLATYCWDAAAARTERLYRSLLGRVDNHSRDHDVAVVEPSLAATRVG